MIGFAVGDKVTPIKDLYDDLRDHGMLNYLVAEVGDELFVREVFPPNDKYDYFAYRVSHEGVLDNSLAVTAHEIQAFVTPTKSGDGK